MRSVIASGLALALSACAPPRPRAPSAFTPDCVDDDGAATVQPQGSLGELGAVRFSWVTDISQDPATPLANGAVATLLARADAGKSAVAAVEVADASVVRVEHESGRCVVLRGVSPGQTIVSALDASGTVLDRASVQVANVDGLAFASGWGDAPGPTVMEGAEVRYRLRLLQGGRDLVGVGIAEFGFEGELEEGNAIPWSDILSIGFFENTYATARAPGTAALSAHVGALTARLPITVVGSDQLTTADAQLEPRVADDFDGYVGVTAFAGTTAVYGASCTWIDREPPFSDVDSHLVIGDAIGPAPWFLASDSTALGATRVYELGLAACIIVWTTPCPESACGTDSCIGVGQPVTLPMRCQLSDTIGVDVDVTVD